MGWCYDGVGQARKGWGPDRGKGASGLGFCRGPVPALARAPNNPSSVLPPQSALPHRWICYVLPRQGQPWSLQPNIFCTANPTSRPASQVGAVLNRPIRCHPALFPAQSSTSHTPTTPGQDLQAQAEQPLLHHPLLHCPGVCQQGKWCGSGGNSAQGGEEGEEGLYIPAQTKGREPISCVCADGFAASGKVEVQGGPASGPRCTLTPSLPSTCLPCLPPKHPHSHTRTHTPHIHTRTHAHTNTSISLSTDLHAAGPGG